MRLPLALAALSAALLTAGAAAAQDPATAGEYRAPLTRMLTETTQGICPADVMANDLLAACESQISQMAPALQSLGGSEGEGADKVERYEVTYDAGPVLTWFIGHRGEDGKFSSAGTGG